MRRIFIDHNRVVCRDDRIARCLAILWLGFLIGLAAAPQSTRAATSESLVTSITPLRLKSTDAWTEEPRETNLNSAGDALQQLNDHDGVMIDPPSEEQTLTGDSIIGDAMPMRSGMPSSLAHTVPGDRLWLISTRSITYNACRANLSQPGLNISRLDKCGRRRPSSLDDYLATMAVDRPRLIYIHGNRREADVAITRGIEVYRELSRKCSASIPIDWVIWSWPSDRETFIISDARIKAERSDTQGLYLAWLLRHHVANGQPTGLIGFSFGARVISSGLHALAGGCIKGRHLEGPPTTNAGFDVGMLAPAVVSSWLRRGGRHAMATKNMDSLVLLYNHKDFLLKNYWLVNRVKGSTALGYSGPVSFAPRFDGSRLPVRSKDCAASVGSAHSEKEFYQRSCCAGHEMAKLIPATLTRQ
ncbi:MAG: hypothetical protein AAF670_20570 [Planctomycetota bacterium]